jgi:hypothetical protein
MQWLEQPYIKWAVPLPLLVAVAPIIWAFFRRTWRELDEEAFEYRRALHARGEIDYRPLVALTLGALVLTFQEYYGRGDAYVQLIRPWIESRVKANPSGWWDLQTYDELYLRAWWALTRVGGYLAPLAVWRLFFKHDNLLDFGLRPRGFREHAWIYALCVVFMVPILLAVSRQGDFVNYYPLYKEAGRSWLDFLVWQALYIAQFLSLGDLLPRLVDPRDARLRRGRDLVDGRALRDDPLRQALPRGLLGHGGRGRARLAIHADAQHLRRISRSRHRGCSYGRAVPLQAERPPRALGAWLVAPRHVSSTGAPSSGSRGRSPSPSWAPRAGACGAGGARPRRAPRPWSRWPSLSRSAAAPAAAGHARRPRRAAPARAAAPGAGGMATKALSGERQPTRRRLGQGGAAARHQPRGLRVHVRDSHRSRASSTARRTIATIDAMLTWRINTVRLPLNESCWLGINGATGRGRRLLPDAHPGVRRPAAREGPLRRARPALDGGGRGPRRRISAPWPTPTTRSSSGSRSPRSSRAIRWCCFDLFNEPYLDLAGAGDAWGCWLSGCNVQGYQSAGMQAMVDAVRGTGAKQVIIAGGLAYANKLDGWLAHKPNDPTGNLMAGFHLYNDATVRQRGLLVEHVGAVAQQVPVVTGELGQRDCGHGFIDGYMSWADSNGVGYLGWAVEPNRLRRFPALITRLERQPDELRRRAYRRTSRRSTHRKPPRRQDRQGGAWRHGVLAFRFSWSYFVSAGFSAFISVFAPSVLAPRFGPSFLRLGLLLLLRGGPSRRRAPPCHQPRGPPRPCAASPRVWCCPRRPSRP